MNYTVYYDHQRIDLLYEYHHHKQNCWTLADRLGIKYTTARNMVQLQVDRKGLAHKHQQMYQDINNPVLQKALLDRSQEQEASSKGPQKVCSLYLQVDTDDEGKMTLFNVQGADASSFTTAEEQAIEVKNAWWRQKNQMTNRKYLKRRHYQFFQGTLQHLNNIDRKATLAGAERAVAKNCTLALLPSLKRRKVSN